MTERAALIPAEEAAAIVNKSRKIQQELLTLTGFDLFRSPRFIEALICQVCRLEQTHRTDSCDGISPSGMRIEIKHSNIIFKGNGSIYFQWENLQGTHRNGKEVNAYIFIGYDYTDDEKPLTALFIPAKVIGKRLTLSLRLNKRAFRGSNKWFEYKCSLDRLRHLTQSHKPMILL